MRSPLNSLPFAVAVLLLLAMEVARGQSPGDTAGVTQLDFQVGLTPGNRLAVDGTGGIHCTWVGTLGDITYNRLDSAGNWFDPGGRIITTGASPQIALDSLERPGIAFYNGPDIAYWTQQHGETDPNPYDGSYSPFLTIDHQENVHIFAASRLESANPPQYFRAAGGGNYWEEPTLIDIDYVHPTTPRVITSSFLSERVAAAYPYPKSIMSTKRYDIYYIQSADGVTWDWDNGRVNITNYEGLLYADRDLDAVYDCSDNLHIVWSARNATDSIASDTTLLFHYSLQTGINEITRYEMNWPDSECSLGMGNRPVCRISIAASRTSSLLAVIYDKFDPGDCSAGGYANGEILCQYSSDGGLTWSVPTSLTRSASPGCAAGDCDSDVGPSMAEKIDDFLHMFFVNDKDAGSIIYNEGTLTNNPLLYLRVPISALDIAEDNLISEGFGLEQNYPNPYNHATTIQYELRACSEVTISIFNLLGQRVATLTKDNEEPGRHRITWDAGGYPSGVYFARLEAGGEARSVKMVLLK